MLVNIINFMVHRDRFLFFSFICNGSSVVMWWCSVLSVWNKTSARIYRKEAFQSFSSITLIFVIIFEGFWVASEPLKTIGDKYCDTHTSFPFSPFWLHVWLLIPGKPCLAWFFEAWENIKSRKTWKSGYH